MTTDAGLRHIALEGAYNIRDVGGYAAADGRATRWRRLLRADSLHRLPEASQRALRDYGLATVVDLRRPGEVRHEPNVFAAAQGVAYHNLPMLADDPEHAHPERRALTTADLYIAILDHSHEQIAEIMRTVARAAAPVLVHCYVGKDRTGVTVALALGAAGVPHETIADDYALSGPLLAPLMAEIRGRLVAEGVDVRRFDALTSTPREAMLATLRHLDERYGGVTGYLAAVGLTDGEIERLRLLLLED